MGQYWNWRALVE